MAEGILSTESWNERRRSAGALACCGDFASARQKLWVLFQQSASPNERAMVASDLASISAVSGHLKACRRGLQRALRLNPDCIAANQNLEFLQKQKITGSAAEQPKSGGPRIAILSLLFNWPSTGGGTVHTKELADALKAGGFEVLHIYAVNASWEVGNVTKPLEVQSVPLVFSDGDWNGKVIQDRFRDAVDEFAPDCVIITDSWNTKPLLAEAVADYPYLLRLAALETICPLNNVRLLFDDGCLVQCLRDQLSSPTQCRQCVEKYERYSGSLHRAERAIAGFNSDDYEERLHRAYSGAAAVLVVNPEIADIVRPFCRRVEVVPSGFSPQRFPALESKGSVNHSDSPTRFIFAGLVDEPMKGFATLFAACQQLWQTTREFELIVTCDERAEWNAPFIRWVGWQSQVDLPDAIRASDVLVFPTIAQEALGRTAVEAMGCGKPVIASRLGGLPWVVEDEVTGLIVTPGDSADLAVKMQRLMDDGPLRKRMGKSGRDKFDRDFPWPVILEKHYEPLFRDLIPAAMHK